MPDLVLASTSVYRRALLERLGVPFRCRAPLCDEVAAESERSRTRRTLAERLAHAKAASLVSAEPGAAIIGCDQVVSFQGQVFGKPLTAARAVDQLTAMAGQISRVDHRAGGDPRRADLSPHRRDDVADATAHRGRRSSDTSRRTSRSTVPAATSSKSRGIVLFEKIESDDHTAITGLPLIALVSILRELGFEIP